MQSRSARASWVSCAAAAAALWAAAPGQAQSPCEIYTAQPGESLGDIAEAAGLDGGAQILLSANSDLLGAGGLVAGTRLRIPCADGSLPALDAAAAPATGAATSAGDLAPVRFLTGGDFAPFVDEAMPDGGMFVELVGAALAAGDPDLGQKTTQIFDWDAHLKALLPTGAFDLGYPWHMPNCAQTDRLSEANRVRCTDYDASDPFFEAVVEYYALDGSPFADIASVEDLAGARICRPSGWFTFDLEERGLVAPAVELVYGAIPTSCWRELQQGRVDVVSYDALTAQGDLTRLGMADEVVELPALTSIATMHVLAPKSNPNGRAYLDVLNRGLADLRADGRWFAIVAKHLGAYDAALRAGN